jgi:superfamily II DNA or RNA helicase
MALLEDIIRESMVKGVLPNEVVTVRDVKWIGNTAIELTYKDSRGNLGQELLYRYREGDLEVLEPSQPWSFTGDAEQFRLVSEARRIELAYLFDPYLAVNTSLVEPLPHQITAVYETMLPRQPLRFLLADDPGAGKTIMTGLLIKELIARGDLQRCLIVCPGNLVEQWKMELYNRFRLSFQIMTNESFETAVTGNWFEENPMAICRLDKLSRNENVQDKLKPTLWDLIVCDEAHKMSATFYGGEVHKTDRRKLGDTLSNITRHFLLLTATPHNGKEVDFQIFMSLLDPDRFDDSFKYETHSIDVSDLMRRVVKEELMKFDGRKLFPERIATTVEYRLSDGEANLYQMVTNYVRQEFSKADRLNNDGRKVTVGFALTVLQRRLASSPEAIHKSLVRRRERLEERLREEQDSKFLKNIGQNQFYEMPPYNQDDFDDLDEIPDDELEKMEEKLVDKASAAQTIEELKDEIAILKNLEKVAYEVLQSKTDKKWEELSRILQDKPEMFDHNGHRRKLIVFTEHRDTLNYLRDRIASMTGRPESIVTIYGGLGLEARGKAEKLFTQDKEVDILLATDAAGEGINLQRSHLMINYDLPWNPNRLEQRFGRIHRIGQTEVCHLWNLVASQTREGEVYLRLLNKINEIKQALGGKVFDILGKLVFDGKPLRELLIEAIRYGDDPTRLINCQNAVDNSLDRQQLRNLLDTQSLVHDSMDVSQILAIKEEMDRAEARKLQPHFIYSFFQAAFKSFDGQLWERESKRYEVKRVPPVIKNKAMTMSCRVPLLDRYERLTFNKNLLEQIGKPLAEFICPGHPLLDATIGLVMERHGDLLKLGSILVDDNTVDDEPRVLVYLENSIQDATDGHGGNRRIVSKQVQFVEISPKGIKGAGFAPYLDYRAPDEDEKTFLKDYKIPSWINSDLEDQAKEYAISELVPKHLHEIRTRKETQINKTLEAVKARLTVGIRHWEKQARKFKLQEAEGKPNAKLNYAKALKFRDDLYSRLDNRTKELNNERALSALPPFVMGKALIVPAKLLKQTDEGSTSSTFAKNKDEVERLAMEAVFAKERELGFIPRDVSSTNCHYDIESSHPDNQTGLRFIEVKGRVDRADIVTVTRTEIMTALNKLDQFILAIAQVKDGAVKELRYIRKPFTQEPEFSVASVNYELSKLWLMGKQPS